jgi:hypothetical protein
MTAMTDKNSKPEGLTPSTGQRVRAIRFGLSLDWWAVLVAVALAVLVRANVLPAIPWEAKKPLAATTRPATQPVPPSAAR